MKEEVTRSVNEREWMRKVSAFNCVRGARVATIPREIGELKSSL